MSDSSEGIPKQIMGLHVIVRQLFSIYVSSVVSEKNMLQQVPENKTMPIPNDLTSHRSDCISTHLSGYVSPCLLCWIRMPPWPKHFHGRFGSAKQQIQVFGMARMFDASSPLDWGRLASPTATGTGRCSPVAA